MLARAKMEGFVFTTNYNSRIPTAMFFPSARGEDRSLMKSLEIVGS